MGYVANVATDFRKFYYNRRRYRNFQSSLRVGEIFENFGIILFYNFEV